MKTVKWYRAFMCTGFIHGGGDCVRGEWRSSYKAAAKECYGDKLFTSAYDDTLKGVEVLEAVKGTWPPKMA